jgi:hypothetical protein
VIVRPYSNNGNEQRSARAKFLCTHLNSIFDGLQNNEGLDHCSAPMNAIVSFFDPILPKLLYFWLLFAPGMTQPFLSPFLALSVEPRFIGLSIGLLQCCSPLAAPLWGLVADYTRQPRLLIATLALAGLVSRAAGLTWLSGVSNSALTTPAAVSVLIGTELVYAGKQLTFV